MAGERRGRSARRLGGVDRRLHGRRSGHVLGQCRRATRRSRRQRRPGACWRVAIASNAIDSRLVNATAAYAPSTPMQTPPVTIPSCAPINPFGVGSVSDAARDYVSTRSGPDYQNTQRDYLATLGRRCGVPFPAASCVSASVTSIDEEEAEFDPLAADQAGIGRLGVPTLPHQTGEYDTNEFSAELLIPILGGDFNLPGAEAVELSGAFRTVDHSLAGTENVWSAGLRWTIVPDITLRGSRSRNFRAPNLTQLFAPHQVTLGAISRDPCDVDRIADGDEPGRASGELPGLVCGASGVGSARVVPGSERKLLRRRVDHDRRQSEPGERNLRYGELWLHPAEAALRPSNT